MVECYVSRTLCTLVPLYVPSMSLYVPSSLSIVILATAQSRSFGVGMGSCGIVDLIVCTVGNLLVKLKDET